MPHRIPLKINFKLAITKKPIHYTEKVNSRDYFEYLFNKQPVYDALSHKKRILAYIISEYPNFNFKDPVPRYEIVKTMYPSDNLYNRVVYHLLSYQVFNILIGAFNEIESWVTNYYPELFINIVDLTETLNFPIISGTLVLDYVASEGFYFSTPELEDLINIFLLDYQFETMTFNADVDYKSYDIWTSYTFDADMFKFIE